MTGLLAQPPASLQLLGRARRLNLRDARAPRQVLPLRHVQLAHRKSLLVTSALHYSEHRLGTSRGLSWGYRRRTHRCAIGAQRGKEVGYGPILLIEVVWGGGGGCQRGRGA